MPVDKQVLEQCIQQAAGSDAEFADYLRKKYEANEALATSFVGGFMTTADYTRKSQELAQQRKQVEGQSGQLETLRQQLQAAEREKDTILKDLAAHRINTAKAREMMQLLQDKYALTDEDLPGMSDLIKTRQQGKPVDSTDGLDERFETFKKQFSEEIEKKFTGAIIPELGAMASLPIVWGEIIREHQDLTGKPLSYKEQQEIYNEARTSSKSLRDVWEDKYKIGGDDGIRMQKRFEAKRKEWESEREKKEADERSKRALEVVTPTAAEMGNGPGISPAFKTKFRTFEMDPNKPAQPTGDGVPTLTVQPGQHVRQAGDRGPSAAQRAAAKYIERVQTGGYGRKAS